MISRKKKMSKILRKNSNGVKKRFNSKLKNKSKKSKKNKNNKSSIMKKKKSILRGGANINARISNPYSSFRRKSKKYREPINFGVFKNLQIRFPKLYEEIEISDSFVHIKYKGYYFIISLDKLSVDKLQYYINKGLTKSHLDNYLTMDENTIVLKILNTGGQYRTGSKDDFTDVYEDSNIAMISYEDNLKEMIEHNRFRTNVGIKSLSKVQVLNKSNKSNKLNISNISNISVLNEDISWLNKLQYDLNTKLNEGKNKIDLFLEKSITEEGKTDYKPRIFSCLDLNVDHSKIIIDKLIVDGEEYVIIGYPDRKMRPYLDLYNKNKEEFNKIHQEHKDKFMEYMAQIHNFIIPDKIDITSKTKLEDEIYKFYGKKVYFKTILTFYENLKNTKLSFEDFKNQFTELHKIYCNNLAKNCLNKPMMNINYVFLIFKKHSNGNYFPAVFNFRELTHKHHPILQRLEIVIKSVLPNRYDITVSVEEYKLWYSRYNYGFIFHIKTEYIHTMSNFQQQSYKYSTSITLEELIYMLSIKDLNLQNTNQSIDLKNLRIEYKKKDINFYKKNGVEIRGHFNNDKLIKTKDKCKVKTKQSQSIDKSINNLVLEQPLEIPIELFTNSNNKILLMYVETGSVYTFIYKNEINEINKIKLKSNLCSIYDKKILDNLLLSKSINFLDSFIKKLEDLNIVGFKSITLANSEFSESLNILDLPIYKIIEHKKLLSTDYSTIMQYNPLLIRKISKLPITDTIDLRYFFENSIFQITDLYPKLEIPNPYLIKSDFIYNILKNKFYQDSLKDFIKNFRIISEKIYIGDNTIISIDMIRASIANNSDLPIKQIYFNPKHFGYNLIELEEKNKSVIWIVPINSTKEKSIYEPKTYISEEEKYFISNIPKTIFLLHLTDLTDSHIELLEFINSINFNGRKCYANISSITPSQDCLHIHIIDDEYYKTNFSVFEQGSRLNLMVSLTNIINCLKLKSKYYNDFEVNMLIHQVH